MGSRLIKKSLGENSFLYRNMLKEISSVGPATTTASTTSMLTGLSPMEHGWLAWDLYFKKENKIVTMFTNKIKDTDIDADSVSLARKYFPYKNICELINEEGKHYAKLIASFNENKYEDIDDMISKIKSSLNVKDKNYIYVYNPEPDTTMHITGTDSKETKDYFELINKKVKELYNSISDDTLLIVVADHGHINCDTIILEDYKDIFDTLDGDTSFEGRLCSFKIKKGREKEFVYLFNKYFSDYFVLMTKEELINSKLLGNGTEHKYFRDSLGDYFALAYSNKYFKYRNVGHIHKSTHAGLTEDEMKIPLIALNKCKIKKR